MHRVKLLNENEKNIVNGLIDEYDIEIADDIKYAFRGFLEYGSNEKN